MINTLFPAESKSTNKKLPIQDKPHNEFVLIWAGIWPVPKFAIKHLMKKNNTAQWLITFDGFHWSRWTWNNTNDVTQLAI